MSPNCTSVACAQAKACYMRSGSVALGSKCPQGYVFLLAVSFLWQWFTDFNADMVVCRVLLSRLLDLTTNIWNN